MTPIHAAVCAATCICAPLVPVPHHAHPHHHTHRRHVVHRHAHAHRKPHHRHATPPTMLCDCGFVPVAAGRGGGDDLSFPALDLTIAPLTDAPDGAGYASDNSGGLGGGYGDEGGGGFIGGGSGMGPSGGGKPVSGVPEASTWLMLIVGFGAIGAMARRTRRAVLS